MSKTLNEYTHHARTFMHNKQYKEFFYIIKEMRKNFPDSDEVFFLFGIYEIHKKDIKAAKASFTRCLVKSEIRYDAAIQLARIYVWEVNYGKAYELIKQYTAAIYNSPYYQDMSAGLLTTMGCHGDALVLLKNAHQLLPESDTISFKLAKSMILSGDVQHAETILLRLISKYPMYKKFHYELSKLKKAVDKQHIQQMLCILRDQKSTENVFLHYALGKEYEDLLQWDDSFYHYSLGGRDALKQSHYDVNDEISTMNAIMKTFNAKWLQSTDENNNQLPLYQPEKTPIFIVGLPRTGTTLIERILASHSAVESVDETFFIPLAVNKLNGIEASTALAHDMVSNVAKISSKQLAITYINMIDYKLTNKPFFIEKYPFNFLYLGLLVKAFPNAKFIYLHRQPIDACFAMYKQSYFKFAYSLDDLSRYYIAHHQLMIHWRNLLGNQLIQINYEDVVKDPDTQIKKMFNKLDLPFETGCFRFYENNTPSGTASTLQVRSPIHTKSINKWLYYASYLEPLISALRKHGINTKPTSI